MYRNYSFFYTACLWRFCGLFLPRLSGRQEPMSLLPSCWHVCFELKTNLIWYSLKNVGDRAVAQNFARDISNHEFGFRIFQPINTIRVLRGRVTSLFISHIESRLIELLKSLAGLKIRLLPQPYCGNVWYQHVRREHDWMTRTLRALHVELFVC